MKKRSKAGTLFRMLAALVLENIRGLNETIQYGKGNERMELMNSRTDALSQKQSALNKLTGTNIAIANTFRTCLHKKCVRIFNAVCGKICRKDVRICL